MSEILVTGATGLTGANVCRQLVERGDTVRALVRSSADSAPLTELGAQTVLGDVTDAASVAAAAKGCDGIIHTAALLGGASQNLADFEAVNVEGTRAVLDAGRDMRVVAVSTASFLDTSGGLPLEQAPVIEGPLDDPYSATKRTAFLEAMARAAAGQHVVTAHPGAIYGPSPVVSRALAATSFNRVLLAALRGRVGSYLHFPVSWVFAGDVAAGSIAALDHGVAGERYILDGRSSDVTSIAAACNLITELAGLDFAVEDVPVSDDPALLERFGPTLINIARQARVDPAVRPGESITAARLGYAPVSLRDGFGELIGWLRGLGKF